MVAYVRRHYGSFMRPTWRLIDPHVIVIHYTDGSSASTFHTFADDVPDAELHELPTDCAHFVFDTDDTIQQLVSLQTMCRHTVGLDWTAIGIEHVGYSDDQVVSDRREITSSLTLVHWLACRFELRISNVIGHNESLQPLPPRGRPMASHSDAFGFHPSRHADLPRPAAAPGRLLKGDGSHV